MFKEYICKGNADGEENYEELEDEDDNFKVDGYGKEKQTLQWARTIQRTKRIEITMLLNAGFC